MRHSAGAADSYNTAFGNKKSRFLMQKTAFY